MDLAIERKIVQLFFVKKERFLWFLENPKRRARIWRDIKSPAVFEPRCVIAVGGNERYPENYVHKLEQHGVLSPVYVMSERAEWDGQFFDLETIIGECLASCQETIGFCQKSEIGFYEHHHSGESYILKARK